MSVATDVSDALARCAVTAFWEQGMCGQFCAAMYGYGFSGYRDAFTQWQRIPAELKFPGDTGAPPGALLFWSGGSRDHGHVAVADGAGSCFSIDIGGPGTVSRAPVSRISQQWDLPFLGWSVPYFQGMQWSEKMINGVDVSDYQAGSGWEKGADFAFVKVTEGLGYTNPKWVTQRDTARAAGLVTGYYHFARPGDMTAQADLFLGKIALRPGDVLMFDWEDAGVTCAQKDAWISYVQRRAPGHRVLLYCNTDFWKNRDTTSFAGDGLWIATGGYPAGSPPIQSAWLIHQYSTAGNLDHDVARFSDRAAMLAWAGGTDVALTASELKLLTETHDALLKITSITDGKVHGAGYYLAHGQADAATVLAQVKTTGTALSGALAALKAAHTKLDAVQAVLASLDLSHVGADVVAKIEALKVIANFTVTEGP